MKQETGCDNRNGCECPNSGCQNHGKCCDCVASHKQQGNLPMCLRHIKNG